MEDIELQNNIIEIHRENSSENDIEDNGQK